MPTDEQIRAVGGNDVGQWGDKDVSGAYDGPLNIAGEQVDVEKLPPFGAPERKSGKRKAPLRP